MSSQENGVGMEKKGSGKKDNMVSKLEGSIMLTLLKVKDSI